MRQTRARKRLRSRRVATSLLILVAAAGWGAFSYSSLSSAEVKKRLQGQTAAIREYQVQYLSERRQSEKLAAALTELRGQLSSAQAETSRLSEGRDRAELELARAQTQIKTLEEAYRAGNTANPAPLIHVTPRPTKRDVAAAQEVLTELRYGSLEADGVAGPDTRRAVEEYQRVMGFPVTGELHAETLQALMHAGKFMAAQEEHSRKTF